MDNLCDKVLKALEDAGIVNRADYKEIKAPSGDASYLRPRSGFHGPGVVLLPPNSVMIFQGDDKPTSAADILRAIQA